MGETPCRPIGFVDELVRRILAGEKTRTRRLLNPQPRARANGWWEWGYKFGAPKATSPRTATWHGETWKREAGTAPLEDYCPLGRGGDLLWVRESYQFLPVRPRRGRSQLIRYLADGAERWVVLTGAEQAKLRARRTSIHRPMPGRFLYRSCARLFLRVESVRVERLQDITEEEARAEGIQRIGLPGDPRPLWQVGHEQHESGRAAFAVLWDSINGKRPGASWEANPWVWALGFSVHQVQVRGEGRAA